VSPKSFLITALLFCAGCGIQIQENVAVTPTELIITATLPPTQTLIPSSTPLPPPPSPTIAPVSGTATTPINVRSAPSTASETIGIIPANTVIQIIGKDPGESWWQILYPQSEQGKAWVSAKYVATTGKPEVPVIGGVDRNSEDGNVGIIQQQINIRSGPGTSFNSIGTLNPQDVVVLSGKDSNGAWLQIEFATGPDGKGWINAAFVQARDVQNLAIVTEGGDVIGTGTPVNTPPPSTPTLVPAPEDNDSAEQPLATLVFEANGTHVAILGNDVSAPNGDAEDWIVFKPFGDSAVLEVECRGDLSLSVSVTINNQSLREGIACGERAILATAPGGAYLVHIQAIPTSGLHYVHYTIRIEANP